MKTKKCRPVLVESKENTGITLGINITRNIPGIMRGQNYQLILISLDPDEKIEVGDKYIVELFNVKGKSTGFHLESCNVINDVWVNNTSVDLTRHINNCKKVIALQSQLSPEYIQQFIEEYNKDKVKDVEIEMVTMNKGYNNHEDSPYNEIDIPKLTNGFVTIVEKPIYQQILESWKKVLVDI